MKMGHIVVARLGDAGGFMVGEVVGLLPVVWVEGSEDVEGSGDLEVHECGGSKKGDTFEPLYVVAGKKRKVGEGGDGADYNIAGENGKAPSNIKCSPVVTTIWCESIVAWGTEGEMLTRGRRLTKDMKGGLLQLIGQ